MIPADKTQFVEFIELFNNGDVEVDLDGWTFTSGIAFEFPAETKMAAGEILVVAQSPEALKEIFGTDALGALDGIVEQCRGRTGSQGPRRKSR